MTDPGPVRLHSFTYCIYLARRLAGQIGERLDIENCDLLPNDCGPEGTRSSQLSKKQAHDLVLDKESSRRHKLLPGHGFRRGHSAGEECQGFTEEKTAK